MINFQSSARVRSSDSSRIFSSGLPSHSLKIILGEAENKFEEYFYKFYSFLPTWGFNFQFQASVLYRAMRAEKFFRFLPQLCLWRSTRETDIIMSDSEFSENRSFILTFARLIYNLQSLSEQDFEFFLHVLTLMFW